MPDTPARLRLPRFSLRSLILFVLLVGSGYGLWARWEPWMLEHTLVGHKRMVKSAIFSPDAKLILSAGEDFTARLWHTDSGKAQGIVAKHQGPLGHVAFSPDGNSVATVGNGVLRIIDLNSRRVTKTFSGRTFAAFSPDGRTVISATRRELLIFNVATEKRIMSLAGHTDYILAGTYAPDGTRIATASDDGTAKIWDSDTGRELHTLIGHRRRVYSVSFSPDGDRVVTGSDDTTARIWSTTSGTCLHVLKERGGVKSATYSPDGTRIVTAGFDGVVRLWNANTGKVLAAMARQGTVLESASFAPDGNRIVVAGRDKTVTVYRRRRPEYWWGVAWLPEFWLTVVLGVGLLWSLWRDRSLRRV